MSKPQTVLVPDPLLHKTVKAIGLVKADTGLWSIVEYEIKNNQVVAVKLADGDTKQIAINEMKIALVKNYFSQES